MRKLSVIAAALAAIAAPASAAAATRAISITSTGFVPRNVTITVGDTVTWSNTDRVAHRVVVARTTCSFTIQPGGSASCPFQNTGRFDYREPNQRGGNWRGTITVQAAPLTVSISAAQGAVTYAGTTMLSGAVSNQRAGENVRIEAQMCGATSFSTVATVTTTTGGAWTLAVKPLKNTVYRARWRSATSANTTVAVRPRLTLRKLTRGRLLIRVSAAQSYAGRLVVLQRYAVSARRWVRVRFVVLRLVGGTAPTVISGRTIRSRLRARTRVRLVMTQTQAGGCYVASTSNIVRR